MSMLVKLLSDDVKCLIANLASDSTLIPKLSSSYLLNPNSSSIELSVNAFVCTEIEAQELLRIALEYCSQTAIQEIRSAMKLCGLL